MLDTPLQQFVFRDKYSRFNNTLKRRETWEETINRVSSFLIELSEGKLSHDDYNTIHRLLLDGTISPSMRLMATAGKVARKNHLLIYNCSYTPVTELLVFPELLWLSMSGVGCGYSLENQYISLLPPVSFRDNSPVVQHVIDDSAEGWVEAFKQAVFIWWSGGDIVFDYSKIRPAGSPLLTKGGTASGPGVLQELMNETKRLILKNYGKKMPSIDIFDLITTIGYAAVSGGVRRSAQICLFDADDESMLNAKTGNFWETHPNRANANISAVWTNEKTFEEIQNQMQIMFDGMSGEPAIVSRRAMNLTKPSWRRELVHGGLNPCAEVNLQGSTADGRFGGQLCNLSSVNIHPNMSIHDLEEATKWATVVGTIQATATDFRLLRKEWKEICEEERILGVSLVGFCDLELVRQPEVMAHLKDVSIKTNMEYAEKLGINRAASQTCSKPAGNSSALTGTARGINPRYSEFFERRVRVGAKTPVYYVLKESGVNLSPENGQENWEEPTSYVATFYEKSPDGAVTVDDMDAMKQLDLWLNVKKYWTTHNPSVTVEYAEDEQESIVDWLYKNQDYVNGIAFLPRSEHVYQQPPYRKITKEEYEHGVSDFPQINWALLSQYENHDMTVKEIECSGTVCDLF